MQEVQITFQPHPAHNKLRVLPSVLRRVLKLNCLGSGLIPDLHGPPWKSAPICKSVFYFPLYLTRLKKFMCILNIIQHFCMCGCEGSMLGCSPVLKKSSVMMTGTHFKLLICLFWYPFKHFQFCQKFGLNLKMPTYILKGIEKLKLYNNRTHSSLKGSLLSVCLKI